MEQTGAQRQSNHGQQTPTKAQENEIGKFIGGLTSAYGSRNRELVASSYSQDSGLIIFWNGKRLNGANGFSQALEGWLNQVDTLSIELQSPKFTYWVDSPGCPANAGENLQSGS